MSNRWRRFEALQPDGRNLFQRKHDRREKARFNMVARACRAPDFDKQIFCNIRHHLRLPLRRCG